MNTPRPLPTVAHVEILPGRAACLTLEDGQAVTISPERTPRACLFALSVPVLVEDWRNGDGPAYRVPSQVAETLSAVLTFRGWGT